MNGVQNITRGPLGKAETRFLAKIAGRATFTIEAARDALAYAHAGSAQKFLERLQEKGCRIIKGPGSTYFFSNFTHDRVVDHVQIQEVANRR